MPGADELLDQLAEYRALVESFHFSQELPDASVVKCVLDRLLERSELLLAQLLQLILDVGGRASILLGRYLTFSQHLVVILERLLRLGYLALDSSRFVVELFLLAGHASGRVSCFLQLLRQLFQALFCRGEYGRILEPRVRQLLQARLEQCLLVNQVLGFVLDPGVLLRQLRHLATELLRACLAILESLFQNRDLGSVVLEVFFRLQCLLS